jgi:F-type H+-transporting ATPase subunit 8
MLKQQGSPEGRRVTKQSNKLNRMPQLIPFFFLNQLSFSFLTLLVLIYVFSKYILPLFTFQQVIRMYITKLSKKA